MRHALLLLWSLFLLIPSCASKSIDSQNIDHHRKSDSAIFDHEPFVAELRVGGATGELLKQTAFINGFAVRTETSNFNTPSVVFDLSDEQWLETESNQIATLADAKLWLNSTNEKLSEFIAEKANPDHVSSLSFLLDPTFEITVNADRFELRGVEFIFIGLGQLNLDEKQLKTFRVFDRMNTLRTAMKTGHIPPNIGLRITSTLEEQEYSPSCFWWGRPADLPPVDKYFCVVVRSLTRTEFATVAKTINEYKLLKLQGHHSFQLME